MYARSSRQRAQGTCSRAHRHCTGCRTVPQKQAQTLHGWENAFKVPGPKIHIGTAPVCTAALAPACVRGALTGRKFAASLPSTPQIPQLESACLTAVIPLAHCRQPC
jgi:hypothetical protein